MEAGMIFVARLWLINIATVVDDRRRAHAQAAVGNAPGQVRRQDRAQVALTAGRHEVAVIVVAADLLVEVEELIDRDFAGVQRAEPVLHPDVVQRPERIVGHGVAPEYVDRVVVDVAADALRVRDLVEARARGDRGVAGTTLRLNAHGQPRQRRRRRRRRIPGYRVLLVRGPR